MAVVYAASLRTSRMQEVRDAIGAGGKLEIGTAGMASVLATFTLGNPAGSVSGDNLDLDITDSDNTVTASATGTAAAARIRTSEDADVVTELTVGTESADAVLDNTSIESGQSVKINDPARITHAS